MTRNGFMKRLKPSCMQTKNSKNERFKTLYKNHKDKIYRLCYGYLYDKNDAEDLFQQVLLNVWENLDSFRGKAQLSTWVYRVAVNTAITYSKKQQKLQNMLRTETDFEHVEQAKTEQSEYDPLPELRMLHQCIHTLEKQDRIIITLYLEDLSYEEIAEVMGITVNYVGVKINRIKKKLHKLMIEK
jgi:RNA polymerase sigma-70 factor (ECF subfamily)